MILGPEHGAWELISKAIEPGAHLHTLLSCPDINLSPIKTTDTENTASQEVHGLASDLQHVIFFPRPGDLCSWHRGLLSREPLHKLPVPTVSPLLEHTLNPGGWKVLEANNWDYGWRQGISSVGNSQRGAALLREKAAWVMRYPPVFPLHTQSHSSWCSRATSVRDLCNPRTPIFGLNWRTWREQCKPPWKSTHVRNWRCHRRVKFQKARVGPHKVLQLFIAF